MLYDDNEEDTERSDLFQKVYDPETGEIFSYLQLGKEGETYMKHGSKTYKLDKIRIYSKTLTVDLEDSRLVDEDNQIIWPRRMKARLDLNGTLFKFKDGSKVMEVHKFDHKTDLTNIRVEIDREKLMKKYQFIYDYAPIMYLNENTYDKKIEGYGWFPSSVDWFMEHMVGANFDGRFSIVSEVPLEYPYQRFDWMHGQIPTKENPVPVYTIVYPDLINSYEGEELDPVEMILNPEHFKI